MNRWLKARDIAARRENERRRNQEERQRWNDQQERQRRRDQQNEENENNQERWQNQQEEMSVEGCERILNARRNASVAEIKQAFRIKAIELHPGMVYA